MDATAGFGFAFWFKASKAVAFACLACTVGVCGTIIGTMTGAVKGQTTETGLTRGAVVGAVAGAVVSMEVMETWLQGELLSKVAIFESILNGKIFCEWVSPAVLKAYQWQISTLEVSHQDSSDIFDITRSKGLLPKTLKTLAEFKILHKETMNQSGEMITCSVCLEDFKDGEKVKRLYICGHIFHVLCIDSWLQRHASCPLCRQEIHDRS